MPYLVCLYDGLYVTAAGRVVVCLHWTIEEYSGDHGPYEGRLKCAPLKLYAGTSYVHGLQPRNLHKVTGAVTFVPALNSAKAFDLISPNTCL